MNRPLYYILGLACMLIATKSYGQFATGKCAPILQMDSAEILFDGRVNKTIIKDHYLYAAGLFNTVGKFSGSFIEINKNTGAAVDRREWPKVGGPTTASIPDGKGGHIIFGGIKSIADTTRTMIGVIDKDGKLTSFNVTIDSAVNAAVLSNGVLYIGGYFTKVNGITRNKLAAIDMSTGNVLSWNPNVKNAGPLPCRIECMIETNGSLYIGGAFSHIGPSLRKNIASININTGALNTWDPGAYFQTSPDYGNVSKMLKVNNMLYICGGFDYVGGTKHPDVAAIDISTGIAASWRPDPNSVVFSLANKGDTLYLGGAFFEISGQSRYSFAAYSISTGNLLPVTINTRQRVLDQVHAILPIGDTLYLGGVFDTTNNICRKNMGSYNRSTGTVLPFTCHSNRTVKHFLYDNNKLYAGGDFMSVDRKLRNYLAAIDLDHDTVTDWYPHVNGEVTGLRLFNDIVYMAGNFTRLNDSVRQYAASLSTKDWTVTKWHPKPNIGVPGVSVQDIVVYKNDIYIGGGFDSVNGQPRTAIAKTDSLGNLLSWIGNSMKEGKVNTMEIGNDTLYYAGVAASGAVDLSNGRSVPFGIGGKEAFAIKTYKHLLYIAYEVEPAPTGPPPPKPPFPTPYCFAIYDITARRTILVADTFNGRVCNIDARPDGNIYLVGGFSNIFLTIEYNPNLGIYHPVALSKWADVGMGYNINVYGNKMYLSGSFANDSSGYLNAALFFDPKVLPDVTIVTDSNSICTGANTTIRAYSTVLSPVTYQWFRNGAKINNSKPYYTYAPVNKDSISCVVTTPANICRWDSWDTSNSVVYNVMPVVTPDITISGPVEEEAGKTVTIKAIVKDADTGYTIEWFNRGVSMGNTKADSISYMKGTGKDSIYAVITPRTDTCYITDTSSLIIVGEKDETGIRSANGGDDRVMIYPNPFDTYVKIKGVEQNDVLLLYDVTGRKVSSTVMSNPGSEYLLSTTMLRAGMYTLKLTDKEGRCRKTILIQKQ